MMSVLSNVRVNVAVVSLRFSLALAVAFLVSVVSSSLPVRLLRYDWQYDFANTVRTSTPLAILSVAFILFALGISPGIVLFSRYVRLARRLGLWIGVGYFLLIPLQGAAGYFEIQRVDFQARSELAATSDVLDRVVQADSPEQLKAVILTVPALAQQLSIQPNALLNFEATKATLIRTGKSNLQALRAAVKQKIANGYRHFWFLLVQNTVILAFYGWAFASLASRWGGLELPRPPQSP
jgi:hypothetical protein